MRRVAKSAFAAISLLLSSRAIAQIGGTGADGVFHPQADVTLDTTTRPGGWDFITVTIPPGVTVRLVGTNPAILRSQGPVRIDGNLDADGFPPIGGIGGAPGPGGYAGGDAGSPGAGPAGGAGGSYSPFGISAGTPGGHATPGFRLGVPSTGTYGDDWVFDLRGGSGAGGNTWPLSWGPPWGVGGGGGGGVVVVLTDSTLDLAGFVSARGPQPATSSPGAAGGIFLRALDVVTIHATARIDAAGIQDLFGFSGSGDGYVRLDGYGASPVIAAGATITPAPLSLAVPAMRHAQPPQVGVVYVVEAATGPGDNVAFFVATGSANIPLPPIGTLELDPTLTLLLGTAVAPNVAPDPQATSSLLVPNNPALVGLHLWLQCINALTPIAAGPRLSNAIATQIR
ncbi:MAG: hypothetical protein U1F36_01480 [Planctomycetota bacterium]